MAISMGIPSIPWLSKGKIPYEILWNGHFNQKMEDQIQDIQARRLPQRHFGSAALP